MSVAIYPYAFIHKYIKHAYTYTYVKIVTKRRESRLNLSSLFANLWNTLKYFTNIYFNYGMMKWYITTLLFHTYQKNINVCYEINQVCCFPGNTYNFGSDWIIKYFAWYIAIQIEHMILDIRETEREKLKSNYSVVNFLSSNSIKRSKNEVWQRSSFSFLSISLSGYTSLLKVHGLSINLNILENSHAICRSHFSVWRKHSLS